MIINCPHCHVDKNYDIYMPGENIEYEYVGDHYRTFQCKNKQCKNKFIISFHREIIIDEKRKKR